MVNLIIKLMKTLTDLPPELIDNIYKLLDIKSKVRFSLSNWYIYDCRPINEIIYRKRIALVINDINSIEYNIYNKPPLNATYLCDSHRILNNMISVYRFTRYDNTLRSVKMQNYDNPQFKYTPFSLCKGGRMVHVDSARRNGEVFRCVY